ncbi:COR domain-containing protein [Acaryochloris marina]|uniref:COR domain-containing protein n=1 Tax=Acaryochloris marina TaxID=155978 RepID=UPI001BAE787C|nr:COR domain-containing protein [Acaryochloris marina]QUY43156.1 leucine-rich repeat domain-containing protein [Acaryochloris marina S15]
MATETPYQKAERKIAEARHTGATKLDLRCNWNADNSEKLTELPESLGQLSQLQSLNLRSNQLTALPESLGRLSQLQTLDLTNNQLTALPESLGRLSQLQSLNLSNNQLTALPESLGQLSQLQSLNLSSNQLTALPESLGRLSQLQTLDLTNNQLTALPESLGQLSQLQSLNLSRNQLTALPESLGQLTQLTELEISSNRLKKLPSSLARLTLLITLGAATTSLEVLPGWLGSLSNLQNLYLGKFVKEQNRQTYWGDNTNKLKTLPKSINQLKKLRLLDLEANQLTALPESLDNCELLEGLFLQDNEALGIPPEVLGPTLIESTISFSGEKAPADPKSILAWYLQSRTEPARRLNEAKMLLVGQGGVGKTSLVHYLIQNKPCNLGELPTEGINIDNWDVQGKKGTGGKFERINVHIWDFGGQEIMHATHQFFLTRRSLYLLVIDARAGEKESNIHYWLKIIQSYGGESPVLVVINKSDQHPHELNETRLIQDYPNIQGFIQTSCSTGQGIAKLRREIGKHIRRLPHVFNELPQSYFDVMAELEQAAAERNYIPIEDYRKISSRYNVKKSENQDRLIRFLHDLGVVLNFQDPDDPYGQNDPYVLNPEWVTDGVYAIINDKNLKEKRDGLLSCQQLSAVLNTLEGYPKNRHDFIVRKMMQFELAYQIDHRKQTHWLIPELLDPKEPKTLQWKPQESLNFQYAYTVLPAGVICRFIVRMHQHVNQNLSWRSGTVLKIDGNTVLVRGDIEKNKVFIAVQGAIKNRKESLAVVRDAFRYVHSTIPTLAPTEEVPLPDRPDVTVPYDHLLKLGEHGESKYFPVGADKCYSVTELLNGIDSIRYQNKRQGQRREERKKMGEKHVFISYCHDNKDDVSRLVEDLGNAGELVWWDEFILGGRDWKEAIREAMKNAYAVVVCLSPDLTKERYRSGVYPEIRDAITTFRQFGPGHSYIFPVRLAKCDVPPIEIDDTRTLERIQHIDLFPETKREAGLQKLLKSLATAPEHP